MVKTATATTHAFTLTRLQTATHKIPRLGMGRLYHEAPRAQRHQSCIDAQVTGRLTKYHHHHLPLLPQQDTTKQPPTRNQHGWQQLMPQDTSADFTPHCQPCMHIVRPAKPSPPLHLTEMQSRHHQQVSCVTAGCAVPMSRP